jgi:CMP-N,N'-diacetyllegionaminic acid synthase
MTTLAVILARAGSKGLPDKCVLPLCGRPVLAYTLIHAQQSQFVDEVVLTTDSTKAAAIAATMGIYVVDRPAELASDTAVTQDAARHAVEVYETETGYQADVVVILGGNVPIRADGLIDACVEHLVRTGCDSVQTVTSVGKYHPDWMYRVVDSRMMQYRPNKIARRQDLEALYCLDGAVLVVRREHLLASRGKSDPTVYLGQDRRAIVQEEECVDIDTLADFYHAEALIRVRSEAAFADVPTAGSRRPPFTAAISLSSHERR